MRYWLFGFYALFCLFCFLSVFISPVVFWPSVFLSYSIPVIFILNSLLLILLLLFGRRFTVFPFIVFLAGLPYVFITYQAKKPPQLERPTFSVLSYNVKFFYQSEIDSKFSMEMIEWVVKDTSSIKCFQEYHTNSRRPELNVTNQLVSKGYYHFSYVNRKSDVNHYGLAMFSKYPIINSGYVWKEADTHNAGIFIDIRRENKIVRIYNVHMKSMGLQLSQMREIDGYLEKLKSVISSLKNGAKRRVSETELLLKHARDSPYPVIIMGDFNETPYSYNYFRLRSEFSNSFETSGKGFGFSMNKVIMFFLRIDHHFYSSGVECQGFMVDRSMKVSDHFATRGVYSLQAKSIR